MLTKQEILLGKGTQVESSRVREPRRTAVKWLAFSGFMVMGFVSGLSLPNHFDSESFLVVHALFSQDGCQREGFWEVVGHMLSPFDLSQTLHVGGWWLISPLFLSRTSCHKTTHGNGYYGVWPGWAVPVSVLPLKILHFVSQILLSFSPSGSSLIHLAYDSRAVDPAWTQQLSCVTV